MSEEYKTAIALHFTRKAEASPNNFQLLSFILLTLLISCVIMLLRKQGD